MLIQEATQKHKIRKLFDRPGLSPFRCAASRLLRSCVTRNDGEFGTSLRGLKKTYCGNRRWLLQFLYKTAHCPTSSRSNPEIRVEIASSHTPRNDGEFSMSLRGLKKTYCENRWWLLQFIYKTAHCPRSSRSNPVIRVEIASSHTPRNDEGDC